MESPATWALAIPFAVGLAASEADMVVISSSDSTIDSGTVITPGRPLNVPPHARVRIIDAQGRVRDLRGPATLAEEPGSPTASSGFVGLIAALLTPEATERRTLAVFRGAGAERPGVWQVDVELGGRHCFSKENTPDLWRSEAGGTVRALLSPATDRGREEQVRWAWNEHAAAWPEALPLRSATYVLRMGAGDPGTELELLEIPAAVSAPGHRVAWLAEQGCERQARRLLKNLAAEGRQ